MNILSNARRFLTRGAALALIATAAWGLVVLCTSTAHAQDADGMLKYYSGHGRTGFPSDAQFEYTAKDEEGKDVTLTRWVPAELERVLRKYKDLGEKDARTEISAIKMMGGTIYFAVFHLRTADDANGDSFGTGRAGFDSAFRAAADSPMNKLDRKAQYLYLYQFVNDRGIDPRNRKAVLTPIKTAAVVNEAIPPTQDLGRFALRMMVSRDDLSSWGYFDDRTFAAKVMDRDIVDIKAAADQAKMKEIRLAVSALPAIVRENNENAAYLRRSTSEELGKLAKEFGVAESRLNIVESASYQAKEAKQINFISAFYKTDKEAVVAVNPTNVRVLEPRSQDRLFDLGVGFAYGVDEDVARSIFVVDFNKVEQGQRSVVFGYTTNLPPTWGMARLDTTRAASEDIREIAWASIFAEAELDRVSTKIAALDGKVALASVETRMPVPQTAPMGFGGVGGGMSIGMGGMQGGFGGGVGVPSWSGGYTRPGGGGFGGVPGTGNGGGTGQGNGNGTGNGNSAATPNVFINFDASLVNQQLQGQFQLQGQQQRQNQTNRGHGHRGGHHGHVVPAPASLLLGLLGLPGLWLLRRRKTEGAEAAVA